MVHPPGEAQVDFGEATIRQGGAERKVALFVMTLPYSGAIFIQAFPRECTETFLEGHRRAFEFFGGEPYRISDDNSAIAVAELLAGASRVSSQAVLPTSKIWIVSPGVSRFISIEEADELYLWIAPQVIVINGFASQG